MSQSHFSILVLNLGDIIQLVILDKCFIDSEVYFLWIVLFARIVKTRMHFSRMRTARSLTVSRCILCMPPWKKPCMPPQKKTLHAPPRKNHACPPSKNYACPPKASIHAPPKKTTHAPRKKHAHPPPPAKITHTPQKKHASPQKNHAPPGATTHAPSPLWTDRHL